MSTQECDSTHMWPAPPPSPSNQRRAVAQPPSSWMCWDQAVQSHFCPSCTAILCLRWWQLSDSSRRQPGYFWCLWFLEGCWLRIQAAAADSGESGRASHCHSSHRSRVRLLQTRRAGCGISRNRWTWSSCHLMTPSLKECFGPPNGQGLIAHSHFFHMHKFQVHPNKRIQSGNNYIQL